MLGRIMMAVMILFPFSLGALAKEVRTQPTSYRTVTEIEDWGASITKVIVDVGRPIPKDSVTTNTFNVHVVRSDNRLKTSINRFPAIICSDKENDFFISRYYFNNSRIGAVASIKIFTIVD
jgi:hypothetical protein